MSSYHEENTATHALAADVATHLSGWNYNSPGEVNSWAELQGPDGMAVHLSKVWNKPRVHVTGRWPRLANGQPNRPSESPSITIARDRGAEAIAQEIRRRFLPAYVAAYRTLKQQVDEDHVRHSAVKVELERLAEMIGQKIVNDGFSRGQGTIYGYGPAGTGFHITFTSNFYSQNCKMVMDSVPFGLARQLVEILGQWNLLEVHGT
jgi:hypothetical protein